ncbi:zinc finger and BTB domain-containing protein 18-like [Mya arenaria]|uniref:zinc finger and BTB domain-containing protein 18-like n=1 Tax=Mya arenaria TaxID=6604 RepID=UPI0022E23045|nr:zinc finger and BTB domain-containing protein 18-like [Mya arenaria]
MSEEQGQRVTSMSEEEEQQATSISEDHDQKETLMSEGRGQQTTSMSEAYSLMYRDLLKSQIKALIDQLSNVGVESVLLTATLTEETDESESVGSNLGLRYITENMDVKSGFRDYCKKFGQLKEIFIPSWAKKRKWTDLQSQNGPEAGEQTPTRQSKRLRVMTGNQQNIGTIPMADYNQMEATSNSPNPGLGQRGVTPPVQMKTEIPDSPLPGTPGSSDGWATKARKPAATFIVQNESPIPKGHHKCSMCNYNSKFKANVTRHEKSVHGMNCDGAMNSTEYVCALCTYRSTYRSNVMRHEKSVHKLSSTWSEIENRKTSFNLDKNLSIVEQTLQRADSVKTENQSDNDSMMLNMADLQSKMAAGFNENAENYTSNDENSADENYQICNYCQLVFSSLPELKNHIDSEHFGSEDFKCETCGKTFGSMFNLHAHVQSVHNAAKQERCACGKTFQYKIGLSRHSKRCPAAKQQSNGVNIEAGTNSEDHSLQGADDLNIDSRRSNLQGMDSMHGTENSNNDSQLSNSAAGESMQGANDFRNGSQDNELVQVSGNIRAKQGTSLEKSEENLNSEESSMDESEMDKHKSDGENIDTENSRQADNINN